MSEPDHKYPLEPLFERIRSPFERFLRRTTAGGIVLMATTFISLGLATLLGADVMQQFWDRPLAVSGGSSLTLELTIRAWVSDALMALFFLLVGLELKREILVGELASIRDAALPVIAATGGMVVPALFYTALNFGSEGANGWGIPMATDIAFAVGIMVLLAWRVPRNLIVFLTALAIADDLGAVLVIAIFYTAELNVTALIASALLLALLFLFNRAGIRNLLPYAAIGALLWFALHASGVHATLAGVLLAAMIPVRPSHSPANFEHRIEQLQDAFRADRRDPDTPDDPLSNSRMASIAEAMERSAVAVQSPLQRMEHGLTPWVTFVIIPLFALANVGLNLGTIEWSHLLDSRVTAGVLTGLVFGKFIGVLGFSWLAVRLGLARLPRDVTWNQLAGAAWLAGIGFTMSLFITQLAFRDASLVEEAKLGILLASLVAAVIGLTWLFWASSGTSARTQPAADGKS